MPSKIYKIISRYVFKNVLFLLLLPMIIMNSSCLNTEPRDGIVATVNGKPISLHYLETFLDSNSTPVYQNLSFPSVKMAYAESLKKLIIQELIEQYLKTKGIIINENILQNNIDEIKKDFLPVTLDEYLNDYMINKSDWEKLMRNYMLISTFKERVLLPSIKISTEEIENYYKLHIGEFSLPDMVEVYFITSPNKEEIEEFCKRKNNYFATINDNLMIQIQEISMKELNEKYRNEFKNITHDFCGTIKLENEHWQTIALGAKNPAQKKELVEVYALIENILLKQKLDEEFEKWLAEAIKNSTVCIVPALKDALLAVGQQ